MFLSASLGNKFWHSLNRNESSLLSPLRKRRPPQHIKHIRNTRVCRIPTFDELNMVLEIAGASQHCLMSSIIWWIWLIVAHRLIWYTLIFRRTGCWVMLTYNYYLRVYGCIRGTMPVTTHIHFWSSNGLI